MREVEVKDIEKELTNLISTRTEDCIYCIHQNPLVFKSREGEINYDYCTRKGISICNSFNMGGIIVANTGDLNMAIMKDEGWRVGENILHSLREKLLPIIPNLEISNNDLLVDGKYKIISYASVNANNRLIYTCFHISLNPDIEAIKNICIKPMNKIPKGLSDFGITRDEIINFIQTSLNNLTLENNYVYK